MENPHWWNGYFVKRTVTGMQIKERNMEEYKKYVDKQHVTEPMIANIMKRLQEEGDKNPKPDVTQNKKKRFYKTGIAFGILTAAVILFVFGISRQFGSRNTLIYTTVDSSMIRAIGDAQGSIFGNKEMGEEIDIGEYESYTKMDFTNLLGEGSLEKSHILVKREDSKIFADEGTFYYKTDCIQAVVHTSKTEELIPEKLQKAEVSQFGNINIIVCKDSDETRFYAYFKKNDLNFCIKCIQAEQREFEDILQKILEF